eukprot:COSAG02_NODE_879_length_16244_cov_15.397956_4_plen_200_part_00
MPGSLLALPEHESTSLAILPGTVHPHIHTDRTVTMSYARLLFTGPSRVQDAGFEQLCLKQNFYFFHEAKHDAMLLARYFNGGRRPWRMADVQQMLWAPVNFIIGVARGSARLVHGAAPATVENEIADEEATVDAQPPPSTRTQLHEQQMRSHAWAHEGQQRRLEEASDQRVHKAAIDIAVEVEEDSDDRGTKKEVVRPC